MAPKQEKGTEFIKDQRVLCFHGDLLYEAKITDVRVEAGKKAEDAQYHIHYKGWKASWDDWVGPDRIRPFDDEHKRLAAELKKSAQLRASVTKGAKKGLAKAAGSELSSGRGSEERTAVSSSFAGRGPRRGKDFDLENEESFHSRPSVNLIIPDVLKGLLVDDWENVTKNFQLVPLPHPKPVTKILDDYSAYALPQRPAGSSHVDILEETLNGLKDYFDKSLGRILLYKFERIQYAEIHKKWSQADSEFEGKAASDIYGAEHLCRLIVSLPELIGQTNMDQQSVSRLREELAKFASWLSKNATEYFVSSYETPPADYVDKAKN
ncbi:MRG-domain-containing protein [Xylariaceae sp. FL0255]|nr:MRG-domain-containing protein [Xylariaceae sp. FL0255]